MIVTIKISAIALGIAFALLGMLIGIIVTLIIEEKTK